MKLYVVDRDDSGYDMVDYGIVGIFSTTNLQLKCNK